MAVRNSDKQHAAAFLGIAVLAADALVVAPAF